MERFVNTFAIFHKILIYQYIYLIKQGFFMQIREVKLFPFKEKDIKNKIPQNKRQGKTKQFWSSYELKYFTFSNLSEIDIDCLHIRYPMSESSVAMYERLIQRGEQLPPILVGTEGQIIDGMHRVIALKNLGFTTVRAYVCKVHYGSRAGEIEIPF